jgi:kynurenine formamidase
MQVMNVIDLSHELYEGMPNLGRNPVSFGAICTFELTEALSGGRMSQQFKLIIVPEHCGTHFDAPAHFDRGGLSTAEYPVDRLVLPGHLLDLSHKERGAEITVGDLEDAEARSGRRISGGTATVVWTGADEYWGRDGYDSHRPYVSVESAQWLLDRGISLFCTDLIGIDDPAAWWWPTHDLWLKAGVPMIQQLRNLGQLVGKEFLFIGLPLPMRNGTGSPVRAVALVTGDGSTSATP